MKAWPVVLAALSTPTPVFAANPNDFMVWNFDRSNDGLETNSNDLPGRLWVPSGPAPAGGYTLVTFFHGAGETGSVDYTNNKSPANNNQGDHIWNTLQVNGNIDNLYAAAQAHGFILYAPQGWGGWASDNYNMAMNQVAKIMQTYDVDPTQIYVTGLSNGGRGTWETATVYDGVFAAAAAICGQMQSGWSTSQTIARPGVLKDLPIWAFHARDDGIVNIDPSTRTGVNLIRNAKGLSSLTFPSKNNGAYPADYYTNGKREYDDGLLRYTEYEFGGHNSWDAAYARSDLYDWMLSQTNDNPHQLQLGETLRFDLGPNTVTTDAQGRYWNSTNYSLGITSGVVRAFAMTDEGRRTAITLGVSNTFQGDSTSQPAGLPNYASDAWFVQNFSGADNLGQITLTGLTAGGAYDLELFGSSTNAGTVRYIIDGVEQTLAFQNNLGTTVTFDGVLASLDGTLTIDVRALGATYAYLNWFSITAVPEPTAIALLLPTLAAAARRRR